MIPSRCVRLSRHPPQRDTPSPTCAPQGGGLARAAAGDGSAAPLREQTHRGGQEERSWVGGVFGLAEDRRDVPPTQRAAVDVALVCRLHLERLPVGLSEIARGGRGHP